MVTSDTHAYHTQYVDNTKESLLLFIFVLIYNGDRDDDDDDDDDDTVIAGADDDNDDDKGNVINSLSKTLTASNNIVARANVGSSCEPIRLSSN